MMNAEDAAYRRAVAVDRILCLLQGHDALLQGHDTLDDAPFDYREAVSWYLAEARNYVDSLQVSRVRQVVDKLAEASNEIRAAALSLSVLLGPTAEALGTATLIDRLTSIANEAEDVSAALCGWPGFLRSGREDTEDTEDVGTY